jgi:short-subunit dehydrogenase
MALALITGASSGIGLQLAKQFAKHGYDLVIACEDEDVQAAAAELSEFNTDVRPVLVDLRTCDGVETLYQQAIDGGRPIDAAALNAGVGAGQSFVDSALEDSLSIIDLNVRSTVHLSRLILPGMIARDAGKVLFTSSIAAMMPGPYQSVYNASKSFIQSFAEALQDELRRTAVTVTSLMPGPTDTNFFRRAGQADNTLFGRMPKDDPAKVAEQGFEALMNGDRKVVAASLGSKIVGATSRLLPDSVKAAANRALAAPLDR